MKPYHPELDKILNLIQGCLDLQSYPLANKPFRELTTYIYRYSMGAPYNKMHCPGKERGYVSRKALGQCRSLMRADHEKPVNQIYRELQGKVFTSEELYRAIATSVKYVHILVIEDNKLTEMGFRSGGLTRYADAGIEVVEVDMIPKVLTRKKKV